MIRSGDTLKNPVTGEVIRFVETAADTGGEYVLVEPDKFGLDRVAEWIRDLSKGQREDTVTAHREEGYAFLVAPALLLLALSLALPERKKGP